MRGRDLIMWSEDQWEASKKIAWEGDKQTDGHVDSLTNSAQRAQRAELVKKYIYTYIRTLVLQVCVFVMSVLFPREDLGEPIEGHPHSVLNTLSELASLLRQRLNNFFPDLLNVHLHVFRCFRLYLGRGSTSVTTSIENIFSKIQSSSRNVCGYICILSPFNEILLGLSLALRSSKKNDASPFGAGRGKQKKYRCFYSSVREILCLPLARFFFTFLLSHNFNFRLIAWFFSFILEFGCHVCKNQHFRNVALHDHWSKKHYSSSYK